MRVRDGWWYFAHPYTVKDGDGRYIREAEEANFRLCCYRTAKLWRAGWLVFSPISHSHPVERACPIMCRRERPDFWYHFDNTLIRDWPFEGIILAPGWSGSLGCRAERQMFIDMGRDVLTYTEIEDVLSLGGNQ